MNKTDKIIIEAIFENDKPVELENFSPEEVFDMINNADSEPQPAKVGSDETMNESIDILCSEYKNYKIFFRVTE
jgi:hypothetical protein